MCGRGPSSCTPSLHAVCQVREGNPSKFDSLAFREMPLGNVQLEEGKGKVEVSRAAQAERRMSGEHERRGVVLRTLGEAVNTYKILAQALGLSPNTIDWVLRSCQYLCDFLGSDPLLDELSVQEVRRWIVALRSRRKWGGRQGKGVLGANSVRRYVEGVRLCLSTLVKEELIEEHPVAKMRLPRGVQREVRAFSDRELKRLLAACDRNTVSGARDYAIQVLLLDCGLRASELSGLQIQDVDLDSGSLIVMGKGKKERRVRLGRRATRALLLYRERFRPQGDGCFFVSNRGDQLNRDSLRKALNRIGERAGVPKTHPHRFRSTFATRYVAETGDILRLAVVLGHTSMQMSRRYVQVAALDSPKRRFSVADALDL